AADAEFAAGGADDGEIADDEGRNGERLADRRIGYLALPHDFAGRLVDREHAAVERDGNHLVLPQCDAAVVDATASHVAGPGAVGARIHLPLDAALLAGGDVDCVHRPPSVRHIHHAILDDGGCFQVAVGVAPAALESAQRYRERRPEILGGVGVDLLELREAVALIVAMVEYPVV